MRVQSMPDTCTARHFYEFLQEYPLYAAQWTREVYDNQLVAQRDKLITQLNLAKLSRIVNVFAFLIGPQTSSRAQLEELGFTCVSDLNNYKYPETSRRLFLMVRDMNDWVQPAAPVVTNTFAQAAPVPVPPAPPRTTAGRPVVVVHFGLEYSHMWFGFRHQTRSRLMAVPRPWGHFITARGTTVDNPFPPGQWVDIPNCIATCPPALIDVNVEVRFHGDGQLTPARLGQDWNWSSIRSQIYSVRRV